MVTQADERRLRDITLSLDRLVRDELTAFFGALNLEQPEAVRDALLQYVPLLVERYGVTAGSIAADWYDDVRTGMNVRGQFRARVADRVSRERVEAMVRFSAKHLFTATPALTLAAIAAPATRYVLESSRLTVIGSTMRDPQARGWQRRTKGDACDFCKALAARGRVYRKYTATFAAHNDCGCAAVPSWDRTAQEVPAEVYMASIETSQMSPARKARHNDSVQRMILDYRQAEGLL